jgi:hypothetical protein
MPGDHKAHTACTKYVAKRPQMMRIEVRTMGISSLIVRLNCEMSPCATLLLATPAA